MGCNNTSNFSVKDNKIILTNKRHVLYKHTMYTVTLPTYLHSLHVIYLFKYMFPLVSPFDSLFVPPDFSDS